MSAPEPPQSSDQVPSAIPSDGEPNDPVANASTGGGQKLENVGISALRAEIDRCDNQILALLNERAAVVKQVGLEKQRSSRDFYQPTREREILERLTANHAGPFPVAAVRPVFREIISACLSLEQPMKIAYLGPEATFTHMACKSQFGLSARLAAVGTIAGVFEEVSRGQCAFGVVPIENSTEGVVNHTLDTFFSYDLRICGEIIIAVSHCLLSRADSLSEIDKVYSHPQAIAQCRRWLNEHLPRAAVVEVASTALAAQLSQGDARGAAVASELASQLYELKILRHKIEDYADNVTRFLIIGKSGRAATGRDKTSLMLSIRDEPGVLYRVLGAFADAGINLTKIESRPSRRRAWDYVFFVDLDGHEERVEVAAAIERVRMQCAFLKVLGSYPRAEVAPSLENS